LIKELIELRERLKSYIMQCMDNTSKTGEPVMRPMFFDFYNDPECYKLSDQYMFGKDILFAPILNEGQTHRSVYLPSLPGQKKWIRTTTKQTFEGSQFAECTAEINEFIAFVKEGSEVLECFV